MFKQLRQFVPSKVCLRCEGCCRFLLADSDWRPKTSVMEEVEGKDDKGFIKTVAHGEMCRCVHLNPKDNSCGVYGHRPFECALYPFILSEHGGTVKMYMHLACPYIQEKEISDELKEHIRYLEEFFASPAVKDELRAHRGMLHDYTVYEMELKYLFDVKVV